MAKDLLNRFGHALLSRAGLVVAITVLVAAAFASQIPRLKADFTPSDLFAAFEDQEEVAQDFRETFGNTDNVVLVIQESQNVLDAGSLTTTAELVNELNRLEEVVRVQSLTTLPVPSRTAATGAAGQANGSDTGVTDAVFDLYDLSASVLRANPADGVVRSDAGDTEAAGEANLDSPGVAEEADAGVEQQENVERSTASMRPVIEGTIVEEADAERVRAAVEGQSYVEGRLVSADRTLSAIAVFLDESQLKNAQIAEAITNIERAVSNVEPPEGERVVLGGLPYIRKTVVDNLRSDQTVLLPAAILVSLIILFLAFRWWAAMLLPTVAVALSAIIMVGLMALVGEPFNILNNIVPTLVIVIGISDSIHVISRYRDEIALGLERRKAAVAALTTMTVACFLTSFTTSIGFVSLGVSKTEILQRFGVTAAVGVLIAYVVTISFVPAALSLVPAPDAKAARNDHGALEDFIERVTRGIIRFRVPVLIAATLLVAASVWVGRTIHVDSAVLDQVNPQSEEYQTTRLIEEKLGGIRPLEFFIRADEPRTLLRPEVVQATRDLVDWAEEQEGVLSSLNYADFIAQARAFATNGAQDVGLPLDDVRQNESLYNMLSEQDRQNPLASYLVNDARAGRVTVTVADMGARRTNLLISAAEQRVDQLFGDIEGVNVRITGDAFSGSRGLDAVISDLTGSLATAIIIIFVFLTVLFRSLRLGLLSVPPNLMPLALTLGYMTLRGVPLNTTTAIIFSISIGLAVDGTIHYLARFREELDADGDVEEALVRAARGTGKAILVTCVALIVGFGVMLVSQFVPIRRFGELIAVTVFSMLLATTLVLPPLVYVGYRGNKREKEA